MYTHRAIEGTVADVSNAFPVILVTGPRQVGKTTMLKQLSESRRAYVTLDDPAERALAKTDPLLFLKRHVPPILIDEVQYAPELLPYIKIKADKDGVPGQYWLTGSQAFEMMRGITETLAGRVGILDLSSLSNRELSSKLSTPFVPSAELITDKKRCIEAFGLKELYRRIFFGGMPALALNERMNREVFFSSYLQTYLERDVRSLVNAGNESSFLRFVTAVAARTGQLLSLSDISRDIGVSVPTITSWISILVSSRIIMLLEPYYNSLLKRIIKAPKIIMMDTGLCCYLTRWNSPESLEVGAMAGSILETWVVSEIAKSFMNAGRKPPLYYYRDAEKREIDLLILDEDRVHPIEIKKGANPNRSDIRSFAVLKRSGLKIGVGGVVCLRDEALPLDEDNWIIPVSII